MSRPDMCIRKAPRHPGCHHAAQGTIDAGARLERCKVADKKQMTCTAAWDYFDVDRDYCDRCIISGELLAQQQGLDPGVYCSRMGVSYSELREANPGSLR